MPRTAPKIPAAAVDAIVAVDIVAFRAPST
jgi:hypothetical protein